MASVFGFVVNLLPVFCRSLENEIEILEGRRVWRYSEIHVSPVVRPYPLKRTE